MFYSDLIPVPLRQHISRYMLRFASHFDEYENSRFVRSVPFSAIPWC